VISPTQGALPDNTERLKQIDIHAPHVIRTHNPSKRAAADPRFRPRGHWTGTEGQSTPKFSVMRTIN